MAAPVFVDGTTPLNAAYMNALGAEINGKVTLPGGAVTNGQWLKGSGGAVVWSAITPADVGLPKITTSTLASGPPGSPADGDIWIATAVDTNGTRWQFQYDAAWVADAFKWKFIGGPFVRTIGGGGGAISASAWVSAGASQTVNRAGIYQASGRYVFSVGNAAAHNVFAGIAAGAFGATSYQNNTTPVGSTVGFVYSTGEVTATLGATAGQAINLCATASGAGDTLVVASLDVLPIRIS